MQDFRDGEHDAFEKVYFFHRNGMYSLCKRYTRCAEDAKDVLQESFLKLYKTRQKYKPEFPIAGWIRTITVRVALDYIRKNYKLINALDIAEFQDLSLEEDNLYDYSAKKEILLNVYTKLPKGYQKIFYLYVFQAMSHKEIADSLNISISTSKSQFFRAKRMIQSLLLDYHWSD